MKAYERSLFSTADSNTFFDVFGNSVLRNELPKLSAIFSIKDSITEIFTHLNYKNSSIIIDENTETTFEAISDAMLFNMQKIEILLYQMMVQRKLTQQDIEAMEFFYRLEEQRIDGKVSPDKYNKAINSINADIINPIIKMINVQAMHNFICDELFHAQYRMIDGYNNQCAAIKANFTQVAAGHEIRFFSLYSDNVSFCYQDALKAIFKVLDIFSRWFNYISNFKELKKKVAPAYFSDFAKNLTGIDENPFKQQVQKFCKSLEVFALIRNEITHNESLERNRHILFIGCGTPEVNEKKLFYSKMLFWDHDEHSLGRANGALGFFTQNRDTLVETKNFFVATIKLVAICLEHYFYEIIAELTALGIEEAVVCFGYPEKRQTFSIADIKKQYNHFAFLE